MGRKKSVTDGQSDGVKHLLATKNVVSRVPSGLSWMGGEKTHEGNVWIAIEEEEAPDRLGSADTKD